MSIGFLQHHSIRKQCFEVFWYTHQLAIFWAVSSSFDSLNLSQVEERDRGVSKSNGASMLILDTEFVLIVKDCVLRSCKWLFRQRCNARREGSLYRVQ